MEEKMDLHCLQYTMKCVDFMHCYCLNPYSETNKEPNRPVSDVTHLENTHSKCSVQSKGNIKDDSATETCPLIEKQQKFQPSTSSDFSSDKLVFKIPCGGVKKRPKKDNRDKNSEKENRANNISCNPYFTASGQKQIKPSPINGNQEKLDLLKPVPKRSCSNTLDVQIKKNPKYDGSLLGKYAEKLSTESEKINVCDSKRLVNADNPLKYRCGEGFKKKKYLKKHSRQARHKLAHNTHAVNNPNLVNANSGADEPKLKRKFICLICDAPFAQSSDMRRHQRVHEKSNHQLRINMRHKSPQELILLKTMRPRVSDKSPQYRCISCGHKYWKKDHLLIHSVIHWCSHFIPKK